METIVFQTLLSGHAEVWVELQHRIEERLEVRWEIVVKQQAGSLFFVIGRPLSDFVAVDLFIHHLDVVQSVLSLKEAEVFFDQW